MTILMTVLIYVNEGELETLHEYERRAIPIMARHGGEIQRIIRPKSAANIDTPDEIHWLTFPSEEAFTAYRNDPDSAQIAHLREQAVRKAIFMSGTEITI